MRHLRSAILRLSALAIILGCIAGSVLHADAQPASPPEEIVLPLGAVFEILAQSGELGTQYAWNLSLERTFLQAERGRSFRTRFSQPGRYLLSTEVLRPNGDGIRKAFLINVRTDAAAIPLPQTLLESDPPASSDGIIVLPEGKSLVRLSASADYSGNIALDADTDIDEDQDGDATNDPSESGTFFSTNAASLWLWCTDSLPRTIGITTSGSDGAPAKQRFLITREGPVAETPVVPETEGEILVEDRGNGVMQLGFDEAKIGVGVVPLALWDFGDGEQSMISNPVHRYAASGSFVVRLQITDLRNGAITKDISQTVSVIIDRTEATPLPQAPPEEQPEPADKDEASSESIMPLIARIAGVLIAAIALGAIVVALVAFLRKKRKTLQQHLEDADKKMAIGKEAPKDNIIEGTVAPMVIEEAPETEPVESAEPAEAPEVILGPAPSWLNPAPARPTETTPAEAPAPAVPVATALPTEPSVETASTNLQENKKVNPVPPVPTPAANPLPAPLAPLAATPAMPTEPPPPPPNPPPTPPPAPVTAPVEAVAPPPIATAIELPATPVQESTDGDAGDSDNGDLPAWLQPAPVPPAAVVTPSSPPAPAPIATPPPVPVPVPAPIPAPTPTPTTPVQPAVQKEEAKPEAPKAKPPAPATIAPAAINDKERERRRLKRQRYRANLRRREEQKDLPVAIVRAENISVQSTQNQILPPAADAPVAPDPATEV